MKIKNSNNVCRIIYIFLLIYKPVFMKINTLHLVSLVALLSIIAIKYYRDKVINTFMKSKLWIVFIGQFFAIIYLLIIGILKNKILLSSIYNYSTIAFSMIISILYLYLNAQKNDMSLKECFYELVIVGSIQCFFIIVTLIFPRIQFIIINSMINNGYSDVILKMSEFRCYGFGMNLSSSMPIVQIFIASLTLYFGVNKNKIFILLAILIAFSGIINARSTYVYCFISFFLVIIFTKYNLKTCINIIVLFVIAFISSKYALCFLEKYSISTLNWLTDGVNEINNFMHGINSGYFEVATKQNFWLLPENYSEIFFGANKEIYGNPIYSSDVGYVRDIWVGGLVICSILYSSFILFLTKILTFKNSFVNLVFFLTIAYFVIYNVKSIIIGNNDLVVAFMLSVGYFNVFCDKNWEGNYSGQ